MLHSLLEFVRADKTRKLKKLFGLLEQAKDEVRDEREAAEREKEQLLDTIRGLSRDLKHTLLLLDAYIPKARPPCAHLRALYNVNLLVQCLSVHSFALTFPYYALARCHLFLMHIFYQ